MASNAFGQLFRITTWGESHGKSMGVVIDGCPAGLPLAVAEINEALALRAPGRNAYTSPRKEADLAEIHSGVFEGKTTGAPIAIIIDNQDADSRPYEAMKQVLRPGHANYTYMEKYGVYDYRGGGRASARETVCRVAAGAVAKKLLAEFSIQVLAYLVAMGQERAVLLPADLEQRRRETLSSPIFCPEQRATEVMLLALEAKKKAGDSLGGIVEFTATGLPTGLGDPVYEKLEANLAKAMMSLPASKGFEIGEGFASAALCGSVHNDLFYCAEAGIQTETNHAGGILGGISTGMPLLGRVAFKPTSSIQRSQASIDYQGQPMSFTLPVGSRHDPCVAIRAVPVVEAMLALVLADAVLMYRLSRL